MIRSDARLSLAKQYALSWLHADRALALLRKLLAQGYFKDAGHAGALWTDEGLKPLHGRSDYRKLLAEVGRTK